MKSKNLKYETEEQQEIKKFIFVVLGLIIIIVGIYFFTRAFITKDLNKEASELTFQEGKIDYTAAIVGNMLKKPEKEYYVIAFNSEENEANSYNVIITKYKTETKEIPLKIYFVDLADELNKKYLASNEEEISTSFKSLDSLKLGSITLLRIKEGKVTKFITNIENIKKEFAVK